MNSKTDEFSSQSEILFNPDTHQYFNLEGEEYTSVSKVLARLKVPFDREGRSLNMAHGIAEERGISVEQAQAELLAEWDHKRDSSIDKGNFVHGGLEDYERTGTIDQRLIGPIEYMQEIFKQYYRFYPEVITYSHKYKVAGTTDLVLQRQKSKLPVVDIRDYKTNKSKGIRFNSISNKDGIVKHVNKYMLAPFDYLEECNYVIYSLQLSMYAFMILESMNVRIGNLGIIFFDNNLKPTFIPVPFMYQEAKMLCERNLEIKDLPAQNVRKYPLMPSEVFKKNEFNPEKVTEDW